MLTPDQERQARREADLSPRAFAVMLVSLAIVAALSFGYIAIHQ